MSIYSDVKLKRGTSEGKQIRKLTHVPTFKELPFTRQHSEMRTHYRSTDCDILAADYRQFG